jgi:hypothetical protein
MLFGSMGHLQAKLGWGTMGSAVAERGMGQVVGEEGGGSACRVGAECAVGWV